MKYCIPTSKMVMNKISVSSPQQQMRVTCLVKAEKMLIKFSFHCSLFAPHFLLWNIWWTLDEGHVYQSGNCMSVTTETGHFMRNFTLKPYLSHFSLWKSTNKMSLLNDWHHWNRYCGKSPLSVTSLDSVNKQTKKKKFGEWPVVF